MRRADREVKNINEILAIIDKCDSCNLGLSDNDMPYVLPLNFGYIFSGDKLTLYFHGAKEGKKHDIIKRNPKACFSMDCAHKLYTHENVCEYTMDFASVMGFGHIESLDDMEEKRTGLLAIMRQYSPEREFVFPDKMLESVGILKLTIEEFTAKRHKTNR